VAGHGAVTPNSQGDELCGRGHHAPNRGGISIPHSVEKPLHSDDHFWLGRLGGKGDWSEH
jgi:hypothetical protein